MPCFQFAAAGRWFGALLGLLVFATVAVAEPGRAAVEIHVRPSGADKASGTSEQPLASFAEAQRRVRSHPDKGVRPITVVFHAGVYYLPEAVVFAPEDSGTKAAPIVYAAASGEAVALSGGLKLTLEWKPFERGILKAQVAEGLVFDQLFVNGKRQPLARYPNFDPAVRQFNGYAADAFSPQRTAKWKHPQGGYIHAMHSHLWGDFHYVITGRGAQGNLMYEGGWQNNRKQGIHAEMRMVENVFEELDAPGEWFLDAEKHTLYFLPPPGLELAQATCEAVRLPTLVEFHGTAEHPVRFVSLRGFTLEHAARTFMQTKEPLLRSDWAIYRGGAVFLTGCEDCQLEACTFDQVGGNAVFVNEYNRRVAVRGCHIVGAGASGVAFVGDPKAVRSPLFEYGQRQSWSAIDREPGPKTNNYPADCLVEDCLIHETGRVEKQTAGVEIAMSQGITVRNCSVYDVPRAGINIGDGCWGGHVVEGCDVFDTVLETGDHGAFNSWGRDRYWGLTQIAQASAAEQLALPKLDAVQPVVLRYNRWRCDHGWDIDLDDGSSNYQIYGNVCLHGGLKLREGYDRVCENNVMVGCSFHPHVWFADSRDVFRHNIVAGLYAPIGMPKKWGGACDENFLHSGGAKETRPAKELQAQSGADARSLVGDAQFLAPEKGGFRVAEHSPALALGFQNGPTAEYGVRRSELRAIARTPLLPDTGGAVAAEKPMPSAPVEWWLGAKIKQVTGPGEVSAAGLPKEMGVALVELPDNCAAAKAGLKRGDVVLKLAGKPVNTARELLACYESTHVGDSVKLLLWRDQRELETVVPGCRAVRLSAGAAQPSGAGAPPRYDVQKDYLGGWVNERVSLRWSATLAEAGEYEVTITLASARSSAGAAFAVLVGDDRLAATTPNTGDWEAFRTVVLGRVKRSQAGPVEVKLIPGKKAGEAVMNLRAISLTPVAP